MNNTLTVEPYIPFIENAKLNEGDKIVFCDIEGTLFRDSLLIELYENIRTSISGDEYRDYMKFKEKWKNRRIKYNTYIHRALDLFHTTIKGMEFGYISNLSYPIIESGYKRVYLFTKQKLKELQSDGYRIIFISGSPHFMVNYFTEKYGFDLGLGTIYHVDNFNCFDGTREALALTEGKEKIVDYIIQRYKPSATVGFGDSLSDMAFLSKVDKGYAVNPVVELYEQVANNSHIDVVFERKELTVVLTPENRKTVEYIRWEE